MPFLKGRLAQSEADYDKMRIENARLLLIIGRIASKNEDLKVEAKESQQTIKKLQENKSTHGNLSIVSSYLNAMKCSDDPLKAFDHSHSAVYGSVHRLDSK